VNPESSIATSTESASLLWTLEEISLLVSRSGNPAETLTNIANLICQRFATDVCSVYLLEPDRANLVLAATVGLRPESVGQVRMHVTEGLAGLVAEKVRPVVVADATSHPRFKYFSNAGEDPYRTFLGVPVMEHGVLQGVLVIQTREARLFADDDVRLLSTAGAQLAPLVSEARTVGQFVAPVHQRLAALARNLWWSWDADSVSLFRDLDPVLWHGCGHNPIAMLDQIDGERLEQRVAQMALHGRINHAYRRMQEYLRSKHTWGALHASVLGARPVAYFSAEFGLHESMPIYSGGLGILAGDHLKSASDLGIPLVAVGLYYDQGYFRQRLDRDGWQHEEYIDVDHRMLPMQPAARDGEPIVIEIETRTGRIAARVWQAAVGRVTLLLLDSNVDGNSPEDRELTARLYGGDQRVRIRQELLLGIGGVKALDALGISPGVIHLNEGHSAFATLELIRRRMEMEGIGVDEALRRVSTQVVFTTHTPVPAGHDRFDADLVEEHLGPIRDAIGISMEHFLGLGRVNPYDPREGFCMTVLALKSCHRANAVSSLHGHVSRAMWMPLYPGMRPEHIPIGHVTNGVHVNTWLAPQMRLVYERHLGANWLERSGGDPVVWDAIEEIDDGELWEAHQALKASLIDVTRRRLVQQAERLGESPSLIAQLRRVLNRDALTIGFARRFATYKRANLLLQDLEALTSLLNHPQMPVQLIFAGKSHPLDGPGKSVLQEVARLTRDPRFLGKIVFIEDYDIDVGRHLVQGVDVWLNNPRRPLEACGTSGQKVVLNGALNLSVLDGWWAEAYDGLNGFAIGRGETHSNTDAHDDRDATSLVRALLDEVVPLYYDRDRDGLPREWIARMKRAIRTLGWRFSAHRMVMDYVLTAYIPAAGGTSSDVRGF
jgi:glycogen phosphorylase